MASRRRSSQVNQRAPGWPLLAVLLAGVVILGGIVLWINNPLSSDDDRHTRYVEAIAGSPARVNPIFAYANEADRDISALVFSGLTRLGPDGTPLPDLAERWDISDDGTVVTFHLRPGVEWHSGSPFTAADVLFTYNLLREPGLQAEPAQAALWQSITCEAPTNLTVSCTLPEPYAPFLTHTTIGILPASILSAVAPQSLLTDPFNRAPVGTGPYRLSSFEESTAILQANADFYLGKPNIDEIELRFFPDMSSAAAEVIRGQADGILADLSIQPVDYRSLREVNGLQSLVSARSASTILYFNTEATPLNDPDVRSAIASALDVDAIITSLLGGRGLRADTPIAPGTWAFSPDARMPDNDVGLSRQMLDGAGWLLPPGASVRTKNDTEMRFSLLTDQDPLRGAVADAVAAQLATVNIEVTIVRQSSNDLVTDYLIPRNYQVAIYGYDPGADPDPYPAWHSSQAIGSGRNIAGYRSDDADALLEEARRTADQDERADLYAEFQGLFVGDRPSIPLYVPLSTYFQSPAVRNVQPGVLFTPSARFHNVWEWAIEERSSVGGQ